MKEITLVPAPDRLPVADLDYLAKKVILAFRDTKIAAAAAQ